MLLTVPSGCQGRAWLYNLNPYSHLQEPVLKVRAEEGPPEGGASNTCFFQPRERLGLAGSSPQPAPKAIFMELPSLSNPLPRFLMLAAASSCLDRAGGIVENEVGMRPCVPSLMTGPHSMGC